MIIFRTANDQLGAIHIAQVFDEHELCVVCMVPHTALVEDKKKLIAYEEQVWLVVV